MSQIDKIAGELRGLMAGAERSRGLAAAVDNKAQEVMIRAGSSGFTAVAAGMVRVRAAVSTIQGGLGGVAEAVSEAAAATAAVPQKGSPQETISGLLPVKSSIVRARDAATGAIAQIGEAKQLVAMVLQGGQPGPMLQALDGVREVVVLMVQRTGTAGELVDAAIAEAGQLGSSGN
ncbi:DUF6244 family protein [Micromonospora sp. DT233]|uniref:DUF6244 family protein n=1 Tax=Micromonospora sp. DT233 TaxID=3393432 RepID=UPI003CEC0998